MLRRRRQARAFFAASITTALFVGAGCSLGVGDGLSSGGPPAMSDSGTTDTNPTNQDGSLANQDGDPSPPDGASANDANNPDAPISKDSILTNGNFETGCTSWYAEAGGTVADETAEPHNGARACRFCAGPDGQIKFAQVVYRPIAVGSKYQFDIWIREAPNAALSPATFHVEVFSIVGGLLPGYVYSSEYTVSDQWAHGAIVFTAAQNAENIYAKVVFSGVAPDAGKPCIVADDALLAPP